MGQFDPGRIRVKVVDVIERLNVFKDVKSFTAKKDAKPGGKEDAPEFNIYPAASVCYIGTTSDEAVPRPRVSHIFETLVVSKNVRGEEAASEEAEVLVAHVWNALNGKTLGLDGVEPFVCFNVELVSYKAGMITYAVQYHIGEFLDVVVE